MMRKSERPSTEIPTSALPDIIFILLFFFMVTTKLKTAEVKVKQEFPAITQIQKLERENQAAYIFVGAPLDTRYGRTPLVEVNGTFISPIRISEFVKTERERMGEKANLIQWVVKSDKNAKMGLMNDVKKELRDVDARDLFFVAERK